MSIIQGVSEISSHILETCSADQNKDEASNKNVCPRVLCFRGMTALVTREMGSNIFNSTIGSFEHLLCTV